MITADQLRSLFPHASADHLDAFAQKNGALFSTYQITAGRRLEFFLAQIGHESGGLTITQENLNYTAQRLCQVWPSRFPTLDSAQPYDHNPQGLANVVYSNRNGNGGPDSGDGWTYHGRGYIQLTGRANYQAVGAACSLDLIGNPDLACAPDSALEVALGFWKKANLNAVCDAGSEDDAFIAVTRAINGGTNGLDDRKAWLQKVQEVLSGTAALTLTSSQVKGLQQALIDAGYTEVGAVDGCLGGHTDEAIQRFRQDKGLSTTPLIDAALLAALGLPAA